MPGRLLLVADADASTGVGRVGFELGRHLQRVFELEHYSFQRSGQLAPPHWPVRYHPSGEHPHSIDNLLAFVRECRPEYMLAYTNFAFADKFLDLLAHYPIPSMLYVAIECVSLEADSSLSRFRRFTRLATFTEFGCAETRRLVWSEMGGTNPQIASVPHGVNLNAFHPHPINRVAARRDYFGHDELHDAFIVLNGNRNDPRKNIPATMQAFARFARGKPDNVLLYLNMRRAYTGPTIDRMARELGISDRVIGLQGIDDPPLDEHRLALLYQSCDVGLNTALAEGWGLVSIEHGATGAPQIVPAHTGPREIWRGHGLLAKIASNVHIDGFGVAGTVDIADTALLLQRLYELPKVREEYGARARALAEMPAFRWSSVAGRLADMIEKLPHDICG